MNTSAALPRRPDEFSKGVWVSIAVHAALFAILLVKSVFLSTEPVVIQNAIRVDIADKLPDKIDKNAPLPAPPDVSKPEAKAPPPPEEAKTQPEPPLPKAKPVPVEKPKPIPPVKTPDAVNLDKVKDKQKDALNKLKAMSALDKIREQQKAEEAEKKRIAALAAASKVQAGAPKVKGARVSPGAALSGIEKLQFEQYWATLDSHIKQYWQLPEWLTDKGFVTIVLVRFDSSGKVTERRISQSSGNKDHDESAIETVDKANPLPAPPEKFVDKVGIEGILVKFGE